MMLRTLIFVTFLPPFRKKKLLNKNKTSATEKTEQFCPHKKRQASHLNKSTENFTIAIDLSYVVFRAASIIVSFMAMLFLCLYHQYVYFRVNNL